MFKDDKIEHLSKKLENLSNINERLQGEINKLKKEIDSLKGQSTHSQEESIVKEPPMKSPVSEPEITKKAEQEIPKEPTPKPEIVSEPVIVSPVKPKVRSKSSEKSIEDYIGRNLISKIGIVVTVLGFAFLVKYAIDKQLINPLTRILLGYLAGIALTILALKLKKKYHNYSAVLLSGGMAIFYFTTFAAYSFYDLIPQEIAFGVMTLFTAFTVYAAIQYDEKIIAHIGLVGAYAIPFLLSDGSGNDLVLLTFVQLINTGILIISIKKYWKSLYYVAFFFTWSIFTFWYFDFYGMFVKSMIFSFLYFITFYSTLIFYKIKAKKQFNISDISMILMNAFIFFGFGYASIENKGFDLNYHGLFSIGNALLHFVVAFIIYSQKLADRNLRYLTSGLVLAFLTIAVSLQLDGHWVTILWASETILLFWIGRTKKVGFYEWLSYPMLILSLISMGIDWDMFYKWGNEDRLFLLNVPFLSSMMVVGSLFGMCYTNSLKKHHSDLIHQKIIPYISNILATIFILVLYFAISNEISFFWDQKYQASGIPINDDGYEYTKMNSNLNVIGMLWGYIYSVIFIFVLFIVNSRFLKNKIYSYIVLGLNGFLLLYFITAVLYQTYELQESFLRWTSENPFANSMYYILIRYITFAFTLLTFVSNYLILRSLAEKTLSAVYTYIFHFLIIVILSSELLYLLNFNPISESDSYSLSILWGLYATFLIVIGIWKKRKHWRYSAIFLFAITLIKVFVYDLKTETEGARILVFISLGILLLAIAFLYQKFKHIIISDDED